METLTGHNLVMSVLQAASMSSLQSFVGAACASLLLLQSSFVSLIAVRHLSARTASAASVIGRRKRVLTTDEPTAGRYGLVTGVLQAALISSPRFLLCTCSGVDCRCGAPSGCSSPGAV